jgi:hypothetical protein
MNSESHDTVLAAFGKSLMWVGALIGSVTLAQVQQVLGIIATCMVIAGSAVSLYTALKRKAWRDSRRADL